MLRALAGEHEHNRLLVPGQRLRIMRLLGGLAQLRYGVGDVVTDHGQTVRKGFSTDVQGIRRICEIDGRLRLQRWLRLQVIDELQAALLQRGWRFG